MVEGKDAALLQMAASNGKSPWAGLSLNETMNTVTLGYDYA